MSRLWSSAVRVQDSQAYRKMDVTRERISCILELRDTFLSFQTVPNSPWKLRLLLLINWCRVDSYCASLPSCCWNWHTSLTEDSDLLAVCLSWWLYSFLCSVVFCYCKSEFTLFCVCLFLSFFLSFFLNFSLSFFFLSFFLSLFLSLLHWVLVSLSLFFSPTALM